jgi:Cu-Zn family superoxide dismutase
MNKLMVVGLSLALGGGLAMAKKAAAPAPVKGDIEAKSGSAIKGTYEITQKGKEVKLVVKVTGAPEGEHAVHVHENGDCSDPDGKKAGGHWNPGNEAHGQWGKEHHHMGDVGNMKVGKDGKGEITLTTDKWTLNAGDPKTDVNGHAIIVHEKVDDFTTQPTGNAGNRIGCGVLGTAAPAAAGGDGGGGGKGTGGGGGKGTGGGTTAGEKK